MTLILASSSPRRRQLIQLMQLPLRIQSADVDERTILVTDPADNAVRTAELKARAIADEVEQATWVIGSDTNVALNGKIFYKPEDAGDAREMLQQLRGNVHQVHTGIFIVHSKTGESAEIVSTSHVQMREYSDQEIAAYIASGDPFDKAGAYSVQHPIFAPVMAIDGCYSGVVGLSLCALQTVLERVGLIGNRPIADWCQRHHHYAPDLSSLFLADR